MLYLFVYKGLTYQTNKKKNLVQVVVKEKHFICLSKHIKIVILISSHLNIWKRL